MKLKNGLGAKYIFQSNVDMGVFFGEGLVVLTYVYGVIVVGDTIKRLTTRCRPFKMATRKLTSQTN